MMYKNLVPGKYVSKLIACKPLIHAPTVTVRVKEADSNVVESIQTQDRVDVPLVTGDPLGVTVMEVPLMVGVNVTPLNVKLEGRQTTVPTTFDNYIEQTD